MKILLTGGGTGGHFYPLIAVARSLQKEAELQSIARVDLYYMSDDPYDADMLLLDGIKFIKVPCGKARRYFSFKYLPDTIKTFTGLFMAFSRILLLLPDAIFSKGGYASFPALFWARFFRIPVLIHESDTVPGIVNTWSGKWADRIAVAFPETVKYFKGKNVALVGNPVRSQVLGGNVTEAVEYFKLEENLPLLLILGGSQGSERINEAVLTVLLDAVKTYQIIHQTGNKNFGEIQARSRILLEKSEFKSRYHPAPFLTEGESRNASRMASIVISRAGASAIFEIAAWGLPSILIPLPEAAQDHQRENAYAYAHSGSCEVLEESNLTPHILLALIEKILQNPEKNAKMRQSAQAFARLDAADEIARELLKLAIHE